MQVIDYFLEMQSLIRNSTFVENVDVGYEVKSKSIGLVHGILEVIDGSTLQFMELINIKRDKMTRLKYRFHLMNANDEMVFRYDNAPHYPEITTHPHHKPAPPCEDPLPQPCLSPPFIKGGSGGIYD